MTTNPAPQAPAAVPAAPNATPFAPFASLPELRAEHAKLLEARRQSNDTPELLQQAAEFVGRGAATGATIDGEEDRRACQSLLDYWANVLDRAGLPSPDPTLAEFDIARAPELPDVPCPYRGLEAFREANSDFFFGREALIDELMEKLNAHRLVAVVGSSGSGKSSVVFAGLLPRLKAGVGADWRIITMVPGTDPLVNLERALGQLRASGDQRPTLVVVDQFEEVFTLCADEAWRKAFTGRLADLAQTPGAQDRVVLTMRTDFVDNVAKLPEFQPLFERAQVDVKALGINELRAAIEKPAEKVGLKFEEGIVDDLISTILGERAGLPLLQFTLLRLWEKRQRNRITREVYKQVGNPREALERSAEAFYADLLPEDQNAVRRILLRMVRPGEGREVTSNRIPLADVFREGVAKDRIERVLHRLIFDERLVKLSGVEAIDPPTSLEALATGRAPANGGNGDRGEVAQVEVAHEALVRNWPRLVSWLDEERVSLRERLLLTETARRWRDSGRDSSTLLRGRVLEDAERYDDLNDTEREFVQSSRAAVDAEIRARQEAQQRELDLAKRQAEQERREAGRLRLLALVLVGLVALASVLAIFAFNSQRMAREAERDARLAEGVSKLQQATAQAAEATAEVDRAIALTAEAASSSQRVVAEMAKATAEVDRAIALTAEADAQGQRRVADAAKAGAEAAERQSRSRERAAIAVNQLDSSSLQSLRTAVGALAITHTAEADTALRRALDVPQPALFLPGSAATGATYSPDGRRIVTVGLAGAPQLWDAQTGNALIELKGHSGSVNGAQFSPDGRLVVTAGTDGTARLWQADTGEAVTTLRGHTASVNTAQFSPDGKRLVTASDDGTARVWDAATFTEVISPPLVHTGAVWSAEFSPDGGRIVTAGEDKTARLWAIEGDSARPLTPPLEHPDLIYSAHFSPDGRYVVTAGQDQLAYIWDLGTRAIVPPRAALRGHDGPVRSAQFSSDGRRVITASDDRTVRIWDAATLREVAALLGHGDRVLSAQFSPDGRQALTASTNGSAWVWDLQPSPQERTLTGHEEAITSAAFSPDGKRVLTASRDNTARLWDANTGQELAIYLRDRLNPVIQAHFSPDGRQLAAIRDDQTVWVFDVETGAFAPSPFTQTAPINSLAFTPDGKRLVLGGIDGMVRVVEVATGRELQQIGPGATNGSAAPINAVAVSPDGMRLTIADDGGDVRIVRLADGRELKVLPRDEAGVTDVAFSPDGARLVTAGRNHSVQIWDAATWLRLLTIVGHGDEVTSAQFSPDGKLIVTASLDGTARLWDANTGLEVTTLGAAGPSLNTASFSPNGRFVVTAGDDQVAKLRVVDVAVLVRLAEARLSALKLK